MARRREYTITISALLGRSTAAVLGDFVSQAERAKKQVDDIMSRPARAGSGAESAAAKEAKARVSEAEKAAKELERIRERENNQILKDVEKITRAEEKAHERAQANVARIKERYFREEQQRTEKADAERAKRNEKIVSGSFSNMAKVASVTSRVAGELARGFGVNFDVFGSMQRGASLEKMAVDLVNAGNRGTGSAAERDAQAKDLQTQARDIGARYRIDPSKVIGGMQQFQAKTGDLTTGTVGLERFAKLAKAFNVELDDMISAAGEISSKLEDSFTPGEKRAQKTYEILKKLTAQGQEGAIEIADLAKETSRIGGGAGFFKGDIGDTITKLGALAQLARQTGGANTAADASRAVAAFVTTLKTPARRAMFEKHDVEYQAADGSFLDPNTIIKNALLKTQGDPQKQIEAMNEMFKSSIGTKPVDALAKAFRAGGGGAGGIAKVDELLAKFGGSVSESTIDENVTRANQTRESKAQEFQNKWDAMIESMAGKVLPAFEKLEPTVLKVAEALAGIVAWAASNPMASVGIAVAGSITASIAKAAIGDVLGKALASGIGSVNPALGLLAAAAVAAAIAIQQYIAAADEAEGKTKKDIEQDVPTLIAKAQKQLKETGTVDKETINDIARKRAELGAARAMEDKTEFGKEKLGLIATIFAGKDVAEAEGTLAATAGKGKEIDALTAKMDALLAEFIKANPPKPKGPMEVKIVGGLVVAAPGTPAPAGTVDH